MRICLVACAFLVTDRTATERVAGPEGNIAASSFLLCFAASSTRFPVEREGKPVSCRIVSCRRVVVVSCRTPPTQFKRSRFEDANRAQRGSKRLLAVLKLEMGESRSYFEVFFPQTDQ